MTNDLALSVLHRLRRAPSADTPLDVLARDLRTSRFRVLRGFQRLVGESPKAYTLRLRLERAAAELVATDGRVLDVALDHGFASHEVFTRAFMRHFGRSPTAHRATARAQAPAESTRRRHQEIVDTTGPCLRLFHLRTQPTATRVAMPMLSIERQEVAAQPVLFVRARVARHELAKAIGSGIGKSYVHAQKAGLAMAGRPFTRYPSMSAGLMTIEAGVPVANRPPALARSKPASCREGRWSSPSMPARTTSYRRPSLPSSDGSRLKDYARPGHRGSPISPIPRTIPIRPSGGRRCIGRSRNEERCDVAPVLAVKRAARAAGL